MTVSFRVSASAFRLKRDVVSDGLQEKSWALPFPRTWMLRRSSGYCPLGLGSGQCGYRRRALCFRAQPSRTRHGGPHENLLGNFFRVESDGVGAVDARASRLLFIVEKVCADAEVILVDGSRKRAVSLVLPRT